MKRKKADLGLTSKKGNIGIIITSVIVLVVFAITMIFSLQVFGDLNDEIQASDDYTNSTKEYTADLYTRAPTVYDGLFILIFVLLWVVALLISWLSENNVAYLIVIIFIMLALILFAAIMSNTYEEIAEDGTLVSFSSQFPYTNFVLNNFVVMALLIVSTVAGVLYVKYR